MYENTTVLEGFLSPSLLKSFIPQAQKINAISSIIAKSKSIPKTISTVSKNISNISRSANRFAVNAKKDFDKFQKSPLTREVFKQSVASAADSYVPGTGEIIRNIPVDYGRQEQMDQSPQISEIIDKIKTKVENLPSDDATGEDIYNYLVSGYTYTDTVENQAKKEFFKKYPASFIMKKLKIKEDPLAPKTAAEVEKGLVDFFDLEKNKKTGKYEPKKPKKEKTIIEKIVENVDVRPVSKPTDKNHDWTDHVNPGIKTPDDSLMDHILPIVILFAVIYFLTLDGALDNEENGNSLNENTGNNIFLPNYFRKFTT